MRRSILPVLVAATSLSISLTGQQPPPRPFSVVQKVGPNDYDVAPDWALPYPKAGYAWGSVPGIFVESDDRIFVASRGEIKLPSPLPAGYHLFFGTVRSALNAPENEVRNCLRIVDSIGKTLEIWTAVGQAVRGHEWTPQDQDQPLRPAASRVGGR